MYVDSNSKTTTFMLINFSHQKVVTKAAKRTHKFKHATKWGNVSIKIEFNQIILLDYDEN